MRLLFVGDSWLGSNARSLREALVRHSSIELLEVNVDHYHPIGRSLVSRIANRILNPLHLSELKTDIRAACKRFRPDCAMFYKGSEFSSEFISDLGVPVVNYFPDCSPHAHGARLADAMGNYNLVISAKSFHPALWRDVYGYSNECVFVPHGYDPNIHLRKSYSTNKDLDIVLVATGRSEYHSLMIELSKKIGNLPLRVAIAGASWARMRGVLPSGWDLVGPEVGIGYTELLSRGKVILAPVQRQILIDGKPQPGDEDSARTYELPAANCFFIHRRTDFVKTIFDEETEVPMYDSPEELGEKIIHALRNSDRQRQAIASAAHRRAVPNYSIDARANQIVATLTIFLPEY
jgi:glycosyltransferase involved in cell wall biosynthesis